MLALSLAAKARQAQIVGERCITAFISAADRQRSPRLSFGHGTQVTHSSIEGLRACRK